MKSVYIASYTLMIFSRIFSFRGMASFYLKTELILDSVALLNTSLDCCTIITSTWLSTHLAVVLIVVLTMAPAARSTSRATAPAVASEAGKGKPKPTGKNDSR